MKEEALQLVQHVDAPARKLNLLREYLQAFALRSLHESEAFISVSFVGGTALRFIWDIPRFSEDLDFSVLRPVTYSPQKWLKKLKTDMQLAGFNVEIKWKANSAVEIAWVKVEDILWDTGIATRRKQKLSIKLEFDTRPPAAATTQQAVLQRHMMFVVNHYDLPSIFSGKLNALLTRDYAKGRDYFDLLWLLSRRPAVAPNMQLLQNALRQFDKTAHLNAANWASLLKSKIDAQDVQKLANDVFPFLERPLDRNLLSHENLINALS